MSEERITIFEKPTWTTCRELGLAGWRQYPAPSEMLGAPPFFDAMIRPGSV